MFTKYRNYEPTTFIGKTVQLIVFNTLVKLALSGVLILSFALLFNISPKYSLTEEIAYYGVMASFIYPVFFLFQGIYEGTKDMLKK